VSGALLEALLGLLVGAGLVVTVGALRGFEPHGPSRQPSRQRPWRRCGIAALVGLLAGLVTGWPVAALFGVVGVAWLPQLFGRPQGHASAERLEAVATWTEMLRDTMAGAAGLNQALIATAPLAPTALRAPLETLATRLEAGVPTGRALRALASELADPAVDVVVAALVLATEQRAGRLGELLSALAETTRREVAMRLRVEARRASSFSSMRIVAGFSLAFACGLLLFARSFLAPYGSALGQLALLVVGAIFGLGLWLMARLVRPPAGERFLARAE
jgi:Flp pilus assembly protein TadB